jgi:hypothetical protein
MGPISASTATSSCWIGKISGGCPRCRPPSRPCPGPGPNDPNTVLFRHKQRQEFAALRDRLLGVVEANRQQGVDPSTAAYDPPAPTRAERQLAAAEAELTAAREAAAVREEIARLKTPHISPPPSAGGEVPDQLARLAQLRDAGVLTTEEFETKKAELLGRL